VRITRENPFEAKEKKTFLSIFLNREETPSIKLLEIYFIEVLYFL